MSGNTNGGMWEAMRSKNFLILVLFIVATSISIWLVSMPTPNFSRIVSETHKQISNLKNMNVLPKRTPDINMDETYLELLGFTGHPKLYPSGVDKNANLPVIVTEVTSGTYESAFSLINSVQKYLSNRSILIFDLGLNSYELVKLQKYCNASTRCQVKWFDFTKFPGHVKDMQIKAFKPIAIQEALNEYGAIIWTDNSEYFVSGDIDSILKRAQKAGLAAWTIESAEPTSALTHPKMFSYFHTQKDLYYFHRMVSADHLVIYNTHTVHKQLMLHWVECALNLQCICPMGAQNVGCNSLRKPLFRYSGCHRYDMSALNVILGRMFKYDCTEYTVKQPIFGIEKPTEAHEETTTTARDVTGKAGGT